MIAAELLRGGSCWGRSFAPSLLIVGYFVLVSTPWGHQFDDDAFFGRRAFSRKIIRLDSDTLELVNKAALMLAAVVLLVRGCLRSFTSGRAV